VSSPLILTVGVVYLLVAVDQARKGDTGMAIANIGLAMSSR
jgi:hypothetical protein